jgi:hypothetical protein
MRIYLVLFCCLLAGFDLDPPAEDQPLMRLIQSANITISGYHSATPVSTFLSVEGKNSSDIKLMGNDFTCVKRLIKLKDGCESTAVIESNNLK